MNENITIQKAFLKGSLFLKVNYEEKLADSSNAVNKDCSAPIHDDLKMAYRSLNGFLGVLCEQTKENPDLEPATIVFEGEDPEKVPADPVFRFDAENLAIAAKIFCTGFSFSGNGSVTLMGYRNLANGKYLDLVTPSMKWEDSVLTKELADHLIMLVRHCRAEVYMYLFEGKHQPEVQMSLFEEDEEDELNDPLLK